LFQLPVFSSPDHWPTIVDDLGPTPDGASGARYALASNQREYVIKGPSLQGGNPYIGTNELICALLGRLLDLPILPFKLVRQHEELFFASERLRSGAFDFLTREVFYQCDNRDRAYDLVVFDAWVLNSDRYSRNLLAQRERIRYRTHRLRMLFNDHSHALLEPPRQPHQLALYVRTSASSYTKLDFIRDAIIDPSQLRAALEKIEHLTDDSIRTCIQMTPEAWLNPQGRQLVEDFLLRRRDQLRDSFNATPRKYAALLGGAL
jgi:hypothetical protein